MTYSATNHKAHLQYQEAVGVDLDGPAYLEQDSMSNLDLEIVLFVAGNISGLRGRIYDNWRKSLNL